MAVKDNIDIFKGGPTTGGTPALLGHEPLFEGSIWHDYNRKYGVINAGKTTMSELSLGTASKNAMHGTPLNP